jgi:hypothetical protein
MSSFMFSEMNMYTIASNLPFNWPVYTVFLGPWNHGCTDCFCDYMKSVP